MSLARHLYPNEKKQGNRYSKAPKKQMTPNWPSGKGAPQNRNQALYQQPDQQLPDGHNQTSQIVAGPACKEAKYLTIDSPALELIP
jgi:hypothetical protein